VVGGVLVGTVLLRAVKDICEITEFDIAGFEIGGSWTWSWDCGLVGCGRESLAGGALDLVVIN